MWTIPPPGKLRKLTPQNVHLVCFGALLPGYPASFHEEAAKELKIKVRQNLDGEEGDSPILSNELKALQARISLGQSRPRPGEEARRRAGMLLKAFRSLPLEDDELAELIEPELAIADYQDSCRIAESRQNVRAPFRQPLVQTAFPAVDSARGIGFIGRWQVFAPHQQHKKGRAAFALSSPGSEFGCWAVNCLPDARTREGFHCAVRAARELALAKLGRAELDDLIVWLEPEPALALTENVQRDDLPCLWDQTQDFSGASGSLALAVALLQAWTGERLDLRDLVITGDVTDDGQIASVGEAKYKTALESGSKRTLHGFFNEVGAVPNTQSPKTVKDYWQGLLDSPERQRGGIQKMLNYLEHLHKGSLPNSAFPTSTINFVKVTKVETKIEKPNSEEKDSDSHNIDSKKAKTDDFEQDEITEGEDSVRLGFAEFSQLVKQTAYSQAQHPVVLTAGPGMGKTFASCRLAIEQCREWLKSDPLSANLKPALPLWVSLSQIKSLTPEALFESAVSTLSLNSVERQGLKKAFDSESLLVVLDARDQGDSVAVKDAVKKLCDELMASRQTGRSIHVVITTRPIRRGEVWADFGGWQKDCFELRQAEFDLKSLERFVQVRAMGNEKVAAAVITAAKNPKGRSARLTVPVIAEFTTHLCLTDGQGFADKLEEGISGFDLYDALTDSLIRQGITACGLTGSGLLPLKIKQCIGWMCARLWEENPGRNAYKEEDCQMLLLQAHQIILPACSTDDLLLVLSKSGIYEAFLLQFRQVCFVHRSLLEFLRAWWMKQQYMLSPQGNWEGTSPFYDWPLGRLVDRKAWDDQWHETFCFFASFLADYRGEGGRWLVPFLKRIEADDCLIYSRLNLALKCVRQAWFLYEESTEAKPHCDLLEWCSLKRDELRALEGRPLVSWCSAAWHSVEHFDRFELLRLLNEKELWDPSSFSRRFVGSLISLLESEEEWQVRRSLAAAVGSWSVHGDGVLLKRLISRIESEEEWRVRYSLAKALGSWSVYAGWALLVRLLSAEDWYVRYYVIQAVVSLSLHGDAVLLYHLISRLESETNPHVRRSLAAAVRSWSIHGDGVLLERLITRLEFEEDWGVRRSLAAAVRSWSIHGDGVLLKRLISCLESERDYGVRYSLAAAVRSWSIHGDGVLLERLITRLESEEDDDVRDSPASAVGALSVHGDAVLLDRLISRLESAEDWRVRRSLAEAVGSWSVHGDGVLLDRLISSLESERDADVRRSLAAAVGSWSVHGDRGLLERLISRLESEEDWQVRRSLAAAVGALSVHGDVVLLERLFSLLESEKVDYVRSFLASAMGSWSVHGDSGLLDRLISRLKSEEDDDVLESLASAVGSWSVHGDVVLLERLISRLESAEDWRVRRCLAAAVGALSVHGDVVLLERLISRLESEEDDDVRSSLASAVGALSVHGDVVLLERLISRLESEEDIYVRRSLAAAVGSWSGQGDAERLKSLTKFLGRQDSGSSAKQLVETVMRWQAGPEGPRRFLPPDHPFFAHPSRQALAARGVVLVSELTDMTRDD